MSATAKTATQARLKKEEEERDAKMAKQKADREEKNKRLASAPVELIRVDDIHVGDRLRDRPSDKKVAELADLMAQQGQLHPIAVRRNPRPAESGTEYELVIGLHRLEAAKKLKWLKIRATFYDDMNDDAAALAEIDENLNSRWTDSSRIRCLYLPAQSNL